MGWPRLAIICTKILSALGATVSEFSAAGTEKENIYPITQALEA